MHEILGRCGPAPSVFGNQAPDSGNSELIAIGGNDAQKKQWLEPLLRGEITSSFSLTEPQFSGSDPTMIATPAGTRRRRIRDQRAQVVRVERVEGRLHPDDGGHQSRQPAAQGGVVLHHPEGHARARHRPRRVQHAPPVPRALPRRWARRDHPARLPDPGDEPRRRGGRRLRARPEAPQRRPHPPRDAVGRPVRGRVRHDVRAGDQPQHQGRAADREADDPGDDRRVVGRHPRPAAHGPAQRVDVGQRGCVEGPGRDRGAQVLGRPRAARRDRPRHPGTRRARVVDRPPARQHVRDGPPDAHRRRRRRGAQGVRRQQEGQGLQAGRRLAQRARAQPQGRAARRASPSTSTTKPPTSDGPWC